MKTFSTLKIGLTILTNVFISIFTQSMYGSDGDAAFPAVINLVDLNGDNGFAINGITPDDGCCYAVSGLGDINGDGVDDISISAPFVNNARGQSYVVYGSRGKWPKSIDLKALDGNNGFVINGINADDNSGYALSGAGDINGDGINDFLIGAGQPNGAGQSYLLFGSKRPFPPIVNLVDLNGDDGFAINGINISDQAYLVSGPGDVNGDGIDDILVGASAALGASGQVYVVFGSQQKWPRSINLANLNGDNGFAINGINSGDQIGVAVSGAGDVNGDGVADIVIGSWPANTFQGRSYVVFGSKGKWPATMSLSVLNGKNGFAINSIGSDDINGWSVSGGDINGDGLSDVLITAPQANVVGQSYVIFGSKGEWPAAINLVDLNGRNGFTINDIDDTVDEQRDVICGVGDVNGDGIEDILIGNFGIFNFTGQSYIVYGSRQLWPAAIELAKLNGTNGFTMNGVHADDWSGFSVSGVGDFNGDGIADIIIGTGFDEDKVVSNIGQSYVLFGNKTKN